MSDNEETCDYPLDQILHAALLSRGYTVREEEGKLLPAFKIPVAFDTLAYINSRNNGSTVTRLDVETRLPDGRLLYEAACRLPPISADPRSNLPAANRNARPNRSSVRSKKP